MSETGYSRDSERIVLALLEQGRLATRPLVDAAGLDKTQQVHYRFSNYLGPDEYGLVRKHAPDDGEQAEWELTPSGEDWAKANRDDIEVPQTEDEACEVAVQALEKARSALSTAATTSGEFGELSKRIDEAIETAEQASDDVDRLKNVKEQARSAAREEIQGEVGGLKSDVDNMERMVFSFKRRMDDFEKEFERKIENMEKNAAAKKGVDEMADRLDEIESTVEFNSKRLDPRKDHQTDIEEEIEKVEQKLSDHTSYQNHLTKRADRLKERVEDLEEEVESGLF